MDRGIVIVGGGQVAATAANGLRAGGYTGPLSMVAAENSLPYQRPPLSKKYLAGELGAQELLIRQASAYEKLDVAVILGNAAVRIDREDRAVELADGRRLPYDRLLLATGARVRKLNVPGAELAGVHYLRTLADVDGIRAELRPGARLAIVGGGYIGLEVAAVAVKLGLQVTVIEAADRVMSRVVSAQTSRFYERVHAEEGVKILTSTSVQSLAGSRRVEAVHCADGTSVPADLVLMGVGIEPACDLAAQAGLAIEDGILVDEFTRTSDPAICAAGDCTRFPSARYGRRIRLESVQNANDQARAAVATLLGNASAYDPVPWFWSDQYDIKLQIAGLAEGYDRTIVRRRPEEQRKFAVFYLRGDVLRAVEAANSPQEYALARRIIGEQRAVPVDLLADPDVPLKSLFQ